MDRFDALLKVWLQETDNLTKSSLKNYGFGAMLAVRQHRVEESFLDACLDAWDPELHLFWFPDGEM